MNNVLDMAEVIVVDKQRCHWKNGTCNCDCDCTSDTSTSCTGCKEVCPVEAISRNISVEIDRKKCILCGACIDACPFSAISKQHLIGISS
ncbi:MAG TPA: 4Fe-4S dicluster domain-containing protein [Euryarchaeota archaeon]|nr:4Fe-4S dicluster domain-containing protein [Euryarchaeota archaeon]